MNYVLDNNGKAYRRFFEEICAIPHESFKEKAISDYIVSFAKERNLWCYQDELWNVIVKKPASPGYEDHLPVMLQGHTDMVCEKAPGVDFDFDKDPLQLYVEDGYLKARGTTLGADCGHGVAYILAILDDTTLRHPPIEAFFSVQEEAGIGGPLGVDYSQFTAKRLVNTDIMFEGATYLSTANVVGGKFSADAPQQENHDPTYSLRVSGCYGGHAAMDLWRDPANAIQITLRTIAQIRQKYTVRIVSLRGGTIKNNIPTDCELRFTCNETFDSTLAQIVSAVEQEVRGEFLSTDPDLHIHIENVSRAAMAVSVADSQRLLSLLSILPTGVCQRSLSVENFALSSRNLGTVSLEDSLLTVGYMFRSNYYPRLDAMMNEVLPAAELLGAKYHEEYRYYGYTVDKDAPMNQIFAEVYHEFTGKQLQYLYIHGGTDAGTIMHGMHGMDVVCIGPNTENIHRPGERLDIASFDRTYQYFVEFLSRL